MSQQIIDFIKQFQELGATTCFSYGMCYWFAQILSQRFADQETEIVYDEIINHFAVKIDGRIYDITGEITHKTQYHWVNWEEFQLFDEALTKRLYRDCIYKYRR